MASTDRGNPTIQWNSECLALCGFALLSPKSELAYVHARSSIGSAHFPGVDERIPGVDWCCSSRFFSVSLRRVERRCCIVGLVWEKIAFV